MDTYKEIKKEELQKIFSSLDWKDSFSSKMAMLASDSSTKIMIIWMAQDMARDEKKFEEALWIAEYYQNDLDPAENDRYEKEVIAGEDTRTIATVRGSLPHLLSTILSSLNTTYYPRVLKIIEKLVLQNTEKNTYVRMQAMVTLDALAINIYAEKNNDGSVFDFKTEDREKVKSLAFKVLYDDHKYPRVLEHLAIVFCRLWRLNEDEAKNALTYLIYKDFKTKEFNPDYVFENIAPSLIYYAEFRSSLKNYPFNNEFFVELLKQVIKTGSPRCKTTLVWHFWKSIESKAEDLKKFTPYIDLFFEGNYQDEMINQIGLLVEKVFTIDQNLAVDIFEKQINYIKNRPRESKKMIWLLDPNTFLPMVAEKKPDAYIKCLNLLYEVWITGNVFIGDYQRVFGAYSLAPKDKQNELKQEAQAIFQKMKMVQPDLAEIIW